MRGRFNINRPELIKESALKAEMSKANIEKALDAIIETIMEATASGDKVKLIGFGIFEPKEKAPRKVRNPKTKEEFMMGATRVPKFTPGKEFKDAVSI